VVISRGGITKLGCLIIVLILGAGGYFAVNVGEVYMRYMRYKDAMAQEVRFRGELSDESIKERLRQVADSLGLPEEAGRLTLTRERRVLTITSRYSETIELPGFRREIQFAPRAAGVY
jgi:hypothetical protein